MKRLSFFLLFGALCCELSAQMIETRYAIQTTLDGRAPVAYEQIYGALVLNSNTGDLSFSSDLAKVRTSDKRTDSLLADKESIPFTFLGNLNQGLFGIVNEENDDTFHRVVGTISVNNASYPAEAFVRINNLTDKSDMTKALVDLKFTVDPKMIVLPVLSGYFKNVLLFQVNDGAINQNR